MTSFMEFMFTCPLLSCRGPPHFSVVVLFAAKFVICLCSLLVLSTHFLFASSILCSLLWHSCFTLLHWSFRLHIQHTYSNDCLPLHIYFLCIFLSWNSLSFAVILLHTFHSSYCHFCPIYLFQFSSLLSEFQFLLLVLS